MRPSQCSASARACSARPSFATCSLMRIVSLLPLTRKVFSNSASSRARRAVSGWAHRVVVAVTQQIEGDERRRVRGIDALEIRGAGQVDAPLKALKARRSAAIVEGDDFAVEHHGVAKPSADLFERRDDRRKLRRLVVAVARPDPDAHVARGGRHIDERADAVVLRLVDEIGGSSTARRPGWPASAAGTRTSDAMPPANSIGGGRGRGASTCVKLPGHVPPSREDRPGRRVRFAGVARARGAVAPGLARKRSRRARRTSPAPPTQR